MEDKRYDTASYDAERVRQINAERRKRKKQQAKRGKLTYFAIILVVSALLASIGWLLVDDMCALNKEYQEVSFTVSEGDSVSTVASNLKEDGLIRYKAFFKLMSGFFKAKKNIDPGTYELNTNMDYRSLIVNMHDYELEKAVEEGLIRLTIPEGYTVNQIIDLLVENGISGRTELEAACADYEFQDYGFLNDELIGDVNRMEGFLFPDTYDFDPNRSAVFAIDTMLTGFVTHISDELNTQILESGYSLNQIVTIASIIEKEGTGDLSERKNISSVLHNRLATGNTQTNGYLQCDTTIYYALSLEGKEKKDFPSDDPTSYDTPYNTYRYQGLPIGPICNPGLDSIIAAANPTDTDYYYFAAGTDGVNHFFTTYSDHLDFVGSDLYQPD